MTDAFEGKNDTIAKLANIIKDLSDDLSNLSNEVMEMPNAKDTSTFKYMEVREIGNMMVPTQATGDEEVSILETAGGNVFTVYGSFLEQEAGSLFDPYSGIELVFRSGVPNNPVYHTNDLTHVYSNQVEYIFP